MKIYPLYFICFFFFLANHWECSAQKVLGLPVNLQQPRDYYQRQGVMEKIYNSTSLKSTDVEWRVLSDRDNNPVYSSPETSSKVVTNINLGEFFLVSDEQDDWIKIAKGAITKNLRSRN